LKIGLPANNSAKMQPTDHTSIAEAYQEQIVHGGIGGEGGEKDQSKEKGRGSDDAHNLQS
jgi:hypothetical protein